MATTQGHWDVGTAGRIQQLAGRQDQVVTRQQLLQVGAESRGLRRVMRSGHWQPLGRGCYWTAALTAPVPPLRTRARAAVLAIGPPAVVYGATAARLLGFEGLPEDRDLHVAVPESRRIGSRAGTKVHRVHVPAEHLILSGSGGLPLTTPVRTAADALLELDREHGVSMLDSGLHQVLLAPEDRVRVAALLNARRGAAHARYWPGLARPGAESPLESRVRLVCLDGGLCPPLLQWKIRAGRSGKVLARIDMGWPDRWVGLEADGRSVHSQPAALLRDRHRQNMLLSVVPQLHLLRFTWADLADPAYIVTSVRNALAARRG